ncbi:MAG: TIGR01458 family HAD-type hydrolase [Gammaproteobacteria bacterium]|nr:MAG: TIGR01458 family HAD-type hydrolase [Gammaproteobacteria bacterium]
MQNDNQSRHGLLIDLDGVIYQSGQLIDGALEALDWIKQQQIPHLFVTNTTSRPRGALLEKFQQLGFSAGLDEVMTPVVAACQWLEQHRIRSVALFVPEATQQDFVDVESVALDPDTAVDAVIIGDLGEKWDFHLLNRAFQYLMQEPQPRLIALGMTRYWRGKNGLQLDVAPFVKALEHAASCEAVVVGKPAQAFFDASLAILQVGAEQALMIGDDIVGDVAAAQHCGIRGIQVRTGKFRPADLEGEIRPFATLDSIADLPHWWSQVLS